MTTLKNNVIHIRRNYKSFLISVIFVSFIVHSLYRVGSETLSMQEIKQKLVLPETNLGLNLSGPVHHGQLGQAKEIFDYFNGKKYGFFVEAGAFNGEYLSNTLLLEVNCSWTGLLVEPNKDAYSKLVTKHRAAHTINTCLSVEEIPMVIEFDAADVYGGINQDLEYVNNEELGKKHQPDTEEMKKKLEAELVNLPFPSDYDERGCPLVPISFSPMQFRLGNMISTYVNFIALEYKLGYKYHLPLYNEWTEPKLHLQSIFKNVSFPTATWSNWTVHGGFNAGPDDVILFNNSRTGLLEVDCGLDYKRAEDMNPLFSDLYDCATDIDCQVTNQSVWITSSLTANHPHLSEWSGDVLPDIILDHLQFTDQVAREAREVLEAGAKLRNVDIENQFMVGVHVRRDDLIYFTKVWFDELLNETYFLEAMEYMRIKHQNVTFLVLSDDTDWCRAHLQSEDVIIVTGHSPAVDLAIMAHCQAVIVDYGTFSVWGGILSGGEVVISNLTFFDSRYVADYLGWTYM